MHPRFLLVLALFAVFPGSSSAQILLDSTEDLDYDRPEAWAMKYFTAVSLMGSFGDSDPLEPGEIRLGFDGAWVPSLSEEKRRVGFIGTKTEDLNRSPVFGRARARVGLPAGWDLTLGVVPPAEFDGVTPKVLNLALGRSVVSRPRWSLSARLSAQSGSIEGDLTCPAGVVGSTDPAINPEDCLEPSNDEVTMDYVGIEWTYARTTSERWRPYITASANYFDLEFQVRARYSLFLDRERLLADGWTPSVALGARYQSGRKISLAGEIFYVPLDVVRDVNRDSQNDELLNVRVFVEYRVR